MGKNLFVAAIILSDEMGKQLFQNSKHDLLVMRHKLVEIYYNVCHKWKKIRVGC